MSKNTRQKDSPSDLQSLLQQEQRLEGYIKQIDQQIQAQEDKALGEDWTDGNLLLGWTRHLKPTSSQVLTLSSKDRYFSRSSVTSKATENLIELHRGDFSIEVCKAIPGNKKKFKGISKEEKKSKARKVEKSSKLFHKKRRRIKRIKRSLKKGDNI